MRCCAFALIAFVAVRMVAWAADPFVGTWKLNVEKSEYEGCIKPKAAMLRMEIEGDGLYQIFERTRPDNKVTKSTYEHLFGIEERPPRLPNWSQIKTRVDKNIFEIVMERDGQVMSVERWHVSSDGKKLTHTGSGEDANGEKHKVTAVYERQ
jgi:hypothetical protein